MKNWVLFVRKVLAILLYALQRLWRNGCTLVQVLFACFTRSTILLSTDASFALIAFWIWFVVLCKANGAHSIRDFWVCSYFSDLVCCLCEASRAHSETIGLVRRLGLFVFFGFGLFLRSERSPLGNFEVRSNSGFIHIVVVWFIVLWLLFGQTNNVYYPLGSVVVQLGRLYPDERMYVIRPVTGGRHRSRLYFSIDKNITSI